MPDITSLFQGSDAVNRNLFNQKISDVNAHGNDTTRHVTEKEREVWNKKANGNNAVWVATSVVMADNNQTYRLTIPNFEFTEGCQVTFLAPVAPTLELGTSKWANIAINSLPVYRIRNLNKEELSGDEWTYNSMVTLTLSSQTTTVNGNVKSTAFFKVGAATVPSIFGNGSNGSPVISGIVTLPVPVPHQSIVEMQYKSLTINAGAILKAATFNAGMIIRVQGDCTIHGTIDQSGLAPFTNLQNNYPYPAQLVCGNGGDGGKGGANRAGVGGIGMLKRTYGGGIGGGGGGGGGYSQNYDTYCFGGKGGDSTYIDSTNQSTFIGGLSRTTSPYSGEDGLYGGGGAGGSAVNTGNRLSAAGGNGATGAGASSAGAGGEGGTGAASGGGSGNYGGGVILLYVGGSLYIDGIIKCNGLSGGNSGAASSFGRVGSGGGGGGGGGGSIYIYYKGSYANTGLLQVNGGTGGAAGTGGGRGSSGAAGGTGSIAVIKHAS